PRRPDSPRRRTVRPRRIRRGSPRVDDGRTRGTDPLDRSVETELKMAHLGMEAENPVSGRFTVRAALHEHRLFLCVLGVAALLRAVVSCTYRPAFFFTGDSVVYLNYSAHLTPGEARPILYAVLLRIVLTA